MLKATGGTSTAPATSSGWSTTARRVRSRLPPRRPLTGAAHYHLHRHAGPCRRPSPPATGSRPERTRTDRARLEDDPCQRTTFVGARRHTRTGRGRIGIQLPGAGARIDDFRGAVATGLNQPLDVSSRSLENGTDGGICTHRQRTRAVARGQRQPRRQHRRRRRGSAAECSSGRPARRRGAPAAHGVNPLLGMRALRLGSGTRTPALQRVRRARRMADTVTGPAT